jgi:hypothetical protein
MTHEHLTDEQLSAHLDGEPVNIQPTADGPPDAAVHDGTVEAEITACETCRTRLAALAGARALVRLPVTPVLPSVRAEAVAAAMAEGRRTDQDRGQAPAVLSRQPRRKPRSAGIAIGAVAAAAVLVAVGLSLGASHSNAPSAASSAVAGAPHRSAALGAVPTTEEPAAAVPDFGSISSIQALRSGLAGVPDFSAANQQPTSNDSTAATAAPSKSALVPEASTVPASSPCVMAAPDKAGTSGTPTLVATVTYDHVPALVVVIDASASSSTTSSSRLVVVVARTGCRILARTSL